MQERYEIRGKLGQGGLGTVYRAWDRSLNREVALKRIATSDDEAQQDEATKQMAQESEALAAMQHPNIVTIYDVGSDSDGPFVVMELISGSTLDEITEKAPLTWEDFRELAMQIQEGMIAAQDLGMIHQDLKTSNVMLNWLPSGRFQAKIVDFGLAKFSPRPSPQEVDENDAVYGSIFFMAPEQFEREPVDARTDMYAIGCVYYAALTGMMPFQGETGPQVMAAHLEHRVIPLSMIRKDIPAWVDEWIMWHINRRPDDRPANAREALESFINLDQPHTQTVGQVEASIPKRARLVIPGSAPEPEEEDSMPPIPEVTPEPLKPPTGAPPSVHTTSQHPPAEPEVAPDAPPPAEAAPIPGTGPRGAVGETSAPLSSVPTMSRKKGLSQGAKIAIGSVAAVLIVIVGLLLVSKMGSNQKNRIYNELVALAANPETKEVPVNREQLDLLLSSITLGKNTERQTVYKALFLAKATDSTQVDATIAEFATTRPLPPEVRNVLISDVLRIRKNPEILPTLIEFTRKTGDPAAARAALKAIAAMSGDSDIAALLDIVQFATDSSIRRAAEDATAASLSRSERKGALTRQIASAYESAPSREAKQALLRLLGGAAGKDASRIVTEVLSGDDDLDKLAAIDALKNWPDDSMYETLIEFLAKQPPGNLRRKAHDAALQNLKNPDSGRDPETSKRHWKMLSKNSIDDAEKLQTINGLASSQTSDWAISIMKQFTWKKHGDDVIDRAEKAIEHMKRRREEGI